MLMQSILCLHKMFSCNTFLVELSRFDSSLAMILYSMVSMDLFRFDDAVVVIIDSGVNLVCMCLCVWSMILFAIRIFFLDFTTTNARSVHNFHLDLHVVWILFRIID